MCQQATGGVKAATVAKGEAGLALALAGNENTTRRPCSPQWPVSLPHTPTFPPPDHPWAGKQDTNNKLKATDTVIHIKIPRTRDLKRSLLECYLNYKHT